jgi:hypothetical protein
VTPARKQCRSTQPHNLPTELSRICTNAGQCAQVRTLREAVRFAAAVTQQLTNPAGLSKQLPGIPQDRAPLLASSFAAAKVVRAAACSLLPRVLSVQEPSKYNAGGFLRQVRCNKHCYFERKRAHPLHSCSPNISGTRIQCPAASKLAHASRSQAFSILFLAGSALLPQQVSAPSFTCARRLAQPPHC